MPEKIVQTTLSSGFGYLASPYSHPDPAVREARFHAVCEIAAKLMLEGQSIFCPIAHSHPIGEKMPPGKAVDFDLWMTQDLPILAQAKKFIILKLPGWHESKGIERELEFALENKIPIELMEYTREI